MSLMLASFVLFFLGAPRYELIKLEDWTTANCLANDGAVFGSGKQWDQELAWRDGQKVELVATECKVYNGKSWSKSEVPSNPLKFSVNSALTANRVAGRVATSSGMAESAIFWDGTLYIVPLKSNDEDAYSTGFDDLTETGYAVAEVFGKGRAPIVFNVKTGAVNQVLAPYSTYKGGISEKGLLFRVRLKDIAVSKNAFEQRLKFRRVIPYRLETAKVILIRILGDGSMVFDHGIVKAGTNSISPLEGRTECANRRGDRVAYIGNASDRRAAVWLDGKKYLLKDVCPALDFRPHFKAMNERGDILAEVYGHNSTVADCYLLARK